VKAQIGYQPGPHDTGVEIGCGVGRLTRAIAPEVGTVHAFDISAEMLRQEQLGAPENSHFHLSRGDSLRPAQDGMADLVLAYLVYPGTSRPTRPCPSNSRQLVSRINCIPPRELSARHLVAEYRELPRVFGLMRRKQDQGLRPAELDIPAAYCLGAGHILFFMDKGGWLLRRQATLVREMLRRGYRPAFTDPISLARGLHRAWLGDWRPTAAARRLNRERIAARTKLPGGPIAPVP